MPTYAEKLRDPRWLKRRQEILERDGWRCTECGSDKTELQVHHKRYIKGREPWDYPDDLLTTKCAVCHGAEHLLNAPRDCPICNASLPMDCEQCDGWGNERGATPQHPQGHGKPRKRRETATEWKRRMRKLWR